MRTRLRCSSHHHVHMQKVAETETMPDIISVDNDQQNIRDSDRRAAGDYNINDFIANENMNGTLRYEKLWRTLKNAIKICCLTTLVVMLYYCYKVSENDTDIASTPLNFESERCAASHELKLVENKFEKLVMQFQTISKQLEEVRQQNNRQRFNSEVIDQVINSYTDQVDHALEFTGATIFALPDTYPYPAQVAYSIFGLVSFETPSNPRQVLQPGILPGQCFAFYGTQGRIQIKLNRRIIVRSVAIEHANPKLLEDVSAAPKDFIVYGVDTNDSEHLVELGRYVHKLSGQPETYAALVHNVFEIVEFRIMTNYGRSDFTCVYRFRVHGDPV